MLPIREMKLISGNYSLISCGQGLDYCLPLLAVVVACVQLFQLRMSDPTQAYATRLKGSVGSCKSDLV